MPSSYNKVRPQTRLDQLIAHMHAHSSVPIIDVREDFRVAKERERLYDLTDSHWNARGAFLAYRRIAEHSLRGFRDIGRSLALTCASFRSSIWAATWPGCSACRPTCWNSASSWFPSCPGTTSPRRKSFPCPRAGLRTARPSPPTRRPVTPAAVIFRDSFTARLMPFLSAGFQRVVYIWDYAFDRAVIERERPDVVIQEMVERCLMGPLPKDH